jgi:uncharacterized membrane protein YphA (DoxX/SURF4 family)
MRYLVALGRLFYSLIFVVAGFGHFTHQEIAYAAAQGVPIAGVLENSAPGFWCSFSCR